MNGILFRDLLMNMLLGLTALVILVLFNINPRASNEDTAKVAGSLVVAIEWPSGPYDVDLWVEGPGDHAVGYSSRGGSVFNLLRDDLGTAGDSSPFNHEDAFGRTLPAGEYVINVHGYSIASELPVHFEVRLMGQANGSQLLASDTISIKPKQERTAIRFRMDDNGHVVPGSVNRIYKPLREATKS